MAIPYVMPASWVMYDPQKVLPFLAEAKAALIALVTTPYQRDWIEHLEKVQLKMEVDGTSRIEGAEFTPQELDAALRPDADPARLNRSQRQARSAAETYRWIRDLPPDYPMSEGFVGEVHRRIVTGCDDDHCDPGRLRRADQNVTFGSPRHRGAEGGQVCEHAVAELVRAARQEFLRHDQLIQALAFHYHFAAIHPFLDGNGRTARAIEAMILQKAGLRDIAFIAMSNYYYDEKSQYLKALADTRAAGHELTPFLVFGLRGVALQCHRVLDEIRLHMEKVLFRSTMTSLFGRLKSARTRVIRQRQLKILGLLLDEIELDWQDLRARLVTAYSELQKPESALIRDLNELASLEAIQISRTAEKKYSIRIRLDWPARITESDFFQRVKNMPKARTYSFLTE